MGLIGLMFVGAVLFVNGLFVLGKTAPRGTMVFNFLVGGLIAVLVIPASVITFSDPATRTIPADNFQFWWTAGSLLFSFTYFMVGGNILSGGDGRAVGWYCLWVSLVALPTGAITWLWLGDWRFALIWWAWAWLWFMFFLLMGLQIARVGRFTGWLTLVNAFVTCTIPAYLVLINRW